LVAVSSIDFSAINFDFRLELVIIRIASQFTETGLLIKGEQVGEPLETSLLEASPVRDGRVVNPSVPWHTSRRAVNGGKKDVHT